MTDLDADIAPGDIPDDLPYVEAGCYGEGQPEPPPLRTLQELDEEDAQAAPRAASAASDEYPPRALSAIYRLIDPNYSTMRPSGIVGDARHLRGYHRSRRRLILAGRIGDYSIQAPADKRGDGNACAGIDISFGPREMTIATRRLMNACLNKDPRIEPLREFFGTLDGRRVTGYNRYPSSNRRVGYTTSDSSHLWHVHISAFRDYATDEAKMRGIADVLNGIPLTPDEGDDMPEPKDVWDVDITLGPAENSAAWYIREIHKFIKNSSAREKEMLERLTAIEAELKSDPDLRP